MDPNTVLLIKMLTDVIMTATVTIAKVQEMSDEEKLDKIREAEAISNMLTDPIRRRQDDGGYA